MPLLGQLLHKRIKRHVSKAKGLVRGGSSSARTTLGAKATARAAKPTKSLGFATGHGIIGSGMPMASKGSGRALGRGVAAGGAAKTGGPMKLGVTNRKPKTAPVAGARKMGAGKRTY